MWDADVKPVTFPCDVCGKVFSRKYILQTQIVIHTGNFKWYCEKCHRCFPQKKNYDLHMKRHLQLET